MATPARRLRAAARLIAGERRITDAVHRALRVLLDASGKALAAAGYDPSVLDSRLPGWRTALTGDVAPAIERAFIDAWEATARGVIDPAPYATRHIEAVTNRLVGVADETFDVLRAELVAGREAQEGIPQLAARIDALLTDEQRWKNRAVTIARTEVVGASNAGATASAGATAAVLGVSDGEVVKEWMSTSDTRTRETHLEADGQQVVGLTTPFTVGGDLLQQPGDPAGSAGEVVNCRCTVVFYYPGDPDYPGESVSAGNVGGDLPRFPAAHGIGPGAALPGVSPALAPAAGAGVPGPQTVAEHAVDPGPQTDTDRLARALTVPELQAEARSGSPAARKAAKAELRRRGVTASGSRPLTEAEVRAGTVDPADLVLVSPDGTTTQTLADFVTGPEEDPVTAPAPEAAPSADAPLDEPTHAGLAVWAADTSRVLMLQRTLDPTDAPDVQGTWEFPGGGIEEGEDAYAGACREFSEETGLPIPDGEVTNGWRSPNGVYQGFVYTVPVEADAFGELNPDLAAAEAVNPDDPERRAPDVTAWFTVEQAQNLGPALRPELARDMDWTVFDGPATEQEETDVDLDTALSLVRTAGYTVGITAAEGDPPPIVTDAPEPTEGPESAEAIPADGDPFYGIIWPENVQSGDGRGIDAGATTWRDLPLPLMAQDAQAPGHDGAVRVGRIDTLTRDDTTYTVPVIRYSGVWDTSDAAAETARQVDAGVVRGISVDGDAVTVELRGSDGQTLDPMTDDFPEDGVVTEVATAARVSGGTVCSIPAFHQAYVANGRLEDRTEPEPGWNADGTPKDNTLDGGAPAPVDPEAEPGDEEPMPLVASAGVPARRAPVWTVTAGASLLPRVDGRFFANPNLTEPTPLTVDDDGRVYGHLATWGTCHIGIDGYCQEPPVSASNYAYFNRGVVVTEDGTRVRVGPLTLGTGHADMTLGLRAAAEHYDNTGTRVADVTIGQDVVGIWFSGRVRPEATPEQVFALAAAGAVSGDWREAVRYSGDLELVAALVVNTPGFSIPRPAVAASAASGLAMVAAGMVARPEQTRAERADTDDVAARVIAALDRREKAQAAASRIDAARTARRHTRASAAAARLTGRK